MKTIEEQAREAAFVAIPVGSAFWEANQTFDVDDARSQFAAGFLAAAAPREELIAELVATLSQSRAWIMEANELPILLARIKAALAKAEARQ